MKQLRRAAAAYAASTAPELPEIEVQAAWALLPAELSAGSAVKATGSDEVAAIDNGFHESVVFLSLSLFFFPQR